MASLDRLPGESDLAYAQRISAGTARINRSNVALARANFILTGDLQDAAQVDEFVERVRRDIRNANT